MCFAYTNGCKILGEDLAQRADNITQNTLVLCTLTHHNVQHMVCFAYTNGSKLLGEDLAQRAHNSYQQLLVL